MYMRTIKRKKCRKLVYRREETYNQGGGRCGGSTRHAGARHAPGLCPPAYTHDKPPSGTGCNIALREDGQNTKADGANFKPENGLMTCLLPTSFHNLLNKCSAIRRCVGLPVSTNCCHSPFADSGPPSGFVGPAVRKRVRSDTSTSPPSGTSAPRHNTHTRNRPQPKREGIGRFPSLWTCIRRVHLNSRTCGDGEVEGVDVDVAIGGPAVSVGVFARRRGGHGGGAAEGARQVPRRAAGHFQVCL